MNLQKYCMEIYDVFEHKKNKKTTHPIFIMKKNLQNYHEILKPHTQIDQIFMINMIKFKQTKQTKSIYS